MLIVIVLLVIFIVVIAVVFGILFYRRRQSHKNQGKFLASFRFFSFFFSFFFFFFNIMIRYSRYWSTKWKSFPCLVQYTSEVMWSLMVLYKASSSIKWLPFLWRNASLLHSFIIYTLIPHPLFKISVFENGKIECAVVSHFLRFVGPKKFGLIAPPLWDYIITLDGLFPVFFKCYFYCILILCV